MNGINIFVRGKVLKNYIIKRDERFLKEKYSYNKSCVCDNCNYHFTHPSAYRKGIVGYCVTEDGYFLCFECPGCGSKYRYHYSSNGEKYGNFEEWKKDVALALLLEGYEQFKVQQ